MKRVPKEIRDYEGWEEEDFAEDLRTHERYQAFFKNYNPNGHKHFINMYARAKHTVHKYKEYYYTNAENRKTGDLKAAEEFLKIILQKKLFNLQCLWRANMIELPFIKYTKDFYYFNKNIWSFPCIEPITEEELEVASEFLDMAKDTTDPDFDEWQNYNAFKVWHDHTNEVFDITPNGYSLYYDEKPLEIPDFYLFYDKHMDTGHLIELPDHRWVKEKYYLDAFDEPKVVTIGPSSVVEETPYEPHLPYLDYDEKDLFVADYEDPITQELFKLQSEEPTVRYNNHELSENIDYLLELREKGEKITLVPHADWYNGILKTVEHVKNRKRLEMLPYAYQTYMLEFEDEDWETIKAKRLSRFKYEEDESVHNFYRERWHRKMDDGKAKRGESED